MLQEGAPAPEFDLAADDGSRIKLADLRGKKVILYFYPKDDTPGCTTQACEIRDRIAEFDAQGAVVLGVSPDSVASHKKFKEKYSLNFPLLSDEGHKIAEAYGVWKQNSMFGVKYWGNERTSFVIDEEGRVAKVLPKVKPGQHAGQVLKQL
ncbi:MAG TPA: thioredoxin-dependent thiol peroxidase [Longimicrobiales bacterium]|nr:thioredoxin-dependent thiol peroxidase [Longimicrobiales bacterium]